MSNSTKLILPYLAGSQSQKHVTVNESLRKLDALVQLGVKSRTTTAQPASPADADCYILPAGKTGAQWGAMSNEAIAYYVDGAWSQLTPKEGWRAFVQDADELVVYDGAAWAPLAGAANENLLVNGDFLINQRSFAGGSLSAGVYGFDRWKAASGGANATLSGYVLTLASGELEQVVEPSLVAGLSSLASLKVSVSVEAPSADLTVTLGSQSGTITAGSGRRSVVLTLGGGDSGNLSFKIKKASGTNVTFGRVKLELGATPTPWRPRTAGAELALAHRYYFRRFKTRTYDVLMTVSFFTTTAAWGGAMKLPATMRAEPTVTVSAVGDLSLYVSTDRALGSLSGFLSTVDYGFVHGATIASGTEAVGAAAVLFFTNASNGYVEFSAEL
jgi:hypothetical protein